MNYKEFMQSVLDILSERLEPGTSVELHNVAKNNGISYDAFIIVNPSVNISPTIYIPPYYHRYLEGVDLESIANDILTTYQKSLPESDFDVTLFTDYNKAKNHIIMRLVNYKRNEERLKDIPHQRFLDFAIIFCCLVAFDNTQQGSILIHNEHLNYWNIDCETLYETAARNTPRLLPFYFANLEHLLREVIVETPLTDSNDAFPMYVLSNQHKVYGATVLLYPNLLAEIAATLNKDFIIIPSSIHEVLIIPVLDNTDTNQYTHMIQEVNETQLTDDEILSDHAYFYSRQNRIITFSSSVA